jgi:polysaccharide biosynthesis protein PslH
VRILLITPYLASPGADGGGTVMFNFIKNLSARHEIVYLSFARQQDLINLRHVANYCVDTVTVPLPGGTTTSSVKKVVNLARRVLQNVLSLTTFTPVVVQKCSSQAMTQEIRKAIERHQPDAVHFCFPQMAHYIEACGEVPAVMDTLDVALVGVLRRAMSARRIWTKAYYLLQWLFWVRYESRYFTKFGKILTVTDQDAAALKMVMPNLDVYSDAIAVDVEVAPQTTQGPARKIGFLASFNHQPNIDAALYFEREVFPLVKAHLGEAEFVVAGKNPPAALLEKQQAGVTCLGFVEDVATFYGSVDMVVAPIRFGGGIKLKVLEAMACGKAVVTTSVGAEGIAGSNEDSLIIADNPEEFAGAVIILLADEVRRRNLGAHARQLIDRRFSWRRVIDDMDTIYQLLVQKKGIGRESSRRDA